MTDEITVFGSPISPYVRKVLITLELKGLSAKCVPIVPFFPTDEFKKISPTGRIPVLKQGDFILPDSSAIVQYLEDLVPEPSIFPTKIQDRAQALWFEEYADDIMGRGAIFDLFVEKVIKPRLLKQASDEEKIQHAIEVSLPASLTYLEQHMPETGYLFEDISIADITISSMLVHATFVDWHIDEARWPKCAAYLKHVCKHPAVAKYNKLSQQMFVTSRDEQQALIDNFTMAA